MECPECLGTGGYEVKWSGEWLPCHPCKGTGKVPFKATTVVNIRNCDYDVYIGRAGKGLDGYFGNPHPVYQEGKPWTECKLCNKKHKRGEAIAAYKVDFDQKIKTDFVFGLRIRSLRGKKLGCFCAPDNCHGDIIKQYLDNLPS